MIKTFIVICLLLLFGTSRAQESPNEIFAGLQKSVPEDHEIIFAGSYEFGGFKKTYVFHRLKTSQKCEDLKMKIATERFSQTVEVLWALCGKNAGTIIRTAVGNTFYFPSGERKGSTRAALNGTIFLDEIIYPKCQKGE